MMKRRHSWVGLVLVSVALGGCASGGNGGVVAEDRPQVVATSRVLCDLTQRIAEDSIDLTCILAPGQDPHTYQARPSDRHAVDNAALVLYDGYGFAPSVFNVVVSSRNPAPRVAVLERAVPDPIMGSPHQHDHGHGDPSHEDHSHEDHSHEDHSHEDHSHEDHSHDEHGHSPNSSSDDPNHGDASAKAEGQVGDLGNEATDRNEDRVPDPHVWHQASHNAAIAQVIAAALATVNPDQASRYQANADQLGEEFTEIDTWIQEQVATVPRDNRRLVTPHDAFRYFAAAYGFEVKGALSGLNTDAQPSPRALATLVDQIQAARVPAIFAESTTNPALIQTVADNAGVAVAESPLIVEGPEGPDSPAATTQAMLVVNTCTIVNALGGTCDEANAPLTR